MSAATRSARRACAALTATHVIPRRRVGRARRVAQTVAAAGALLLVAAIVLAQPEVGLMLAPALALALLLIGGRFPGERVVRRLQARFAPKPRERSRQAAPPQRYGFRPRVGRLLIAFALANRPPPASLVTTT